MCRLQLARAQALPLCIGLSIFASGGCVSDPTTVSTSAPVKATQPPSAEPGADDSHPNPASGRAFFPLTVGTRWEYEGSVQLTILDENDSVIESVGFHSDITRELTGTEVLFDREYVVERETGVQDAPFAPEPQKWVYWHRYRQDRSGLYQADVMLTQPPGMPLTALVARRIGTPSVPLSWDGIPANQRAAFRSALQRIDRRLARMHDILGSRSHRPGGPLTQEVTLLRYPLHRGATWKIRDDPDLVIHGVVEGHDVLDLPAGRFPAWRIRVVWDGGDPNDTIRVWYGSSGYLKLVIHGEEGATDESGTRIGTVVTDQAESLESIHLQGRPHSHGPH